MAAIQPIMATHHVLVCSESAPSRPEQATKYPSPDFDITMILTSELTIDYRSVVTSSCYYFTPTINVAPVRHTLLHTHLTYLTSILVVNFARASLRLFHNLLGTVRESSCFSGLSYCRCFYFSLFHTHTVHTTDCFTLYFTYDSVQPCYYNIY